MGLTVGTLDVKLRLDDKKYTRQLSGQKRSTQLAGQTMQKGLSRIPQQAKLGALSMLGLQAGFAGVGVAAVSFGVNSYKAFAQIDRGKSLLRTLNAELVDSKGFLPNLKAVSKEGLVPMAEAMDTVYQIMSAGFTTEPLDILATSANLAMVGMTDNKTAADALTSSLNAYGLSSEHAEEMADILFATQNAGKTTIGELGAHMGKATAQAAGLGVGFADLNAHIAVLTSLGIPTAQAFTAMEAAMRELGNPLTKAAKAFKELTGQTFIEFIAGGKTMEQATVLIGEHLRDLGLTAEEFGFTSESAILYNVAATTSGADNLITQYDRIEGGLDDVSAAAQDFKDDAVGTAAEWELFKDDVEIATGGMLNYMVGSFTQTGQQIRGVWDHMWSMMEDDYDESLGEISLKQQWLNVMIMKENDRIIEEMKRLEENSGDALSSMGVSWMMYADLTETSASRIEASIQRILDAYAQIDLGFAANALMAINDQLAGNWELPAPPEDTRHVMDKVAGPSTGSKLSSFWTPPAKTGSNTGTTGSQKEELTDEEKEELAREKFQKTLDTMYAGNEISDDLYSEMQTSTDLQRILEDAVETSDGNNLRSLETLTDTAYNLGLIEMDGSRKVVSAVDAAAEAIAEAIRKSKEKPKKSKAIGGDVLMGDWAEAFGEDDLGKLSRFLSVAHKAGLDTTDTDLAEHAQSIGRAMGWNPSDELPGGWRIDTNGNYISDDSSSLIEGPRRSAGTNRSIGRRSSAPSSALDTSSPASMGQVSRTVGTIRDAVFENAIFHNAQFLNEGAFDVGVAVG